MWEKLHLSQWCSLSAGRGEKTTAYVGSHPADEVVRKAYSRVISVQYRRTWAIEERKELSN